MEDDLTRYFQDLLLEYSQQNDPDERKTDRRIALGQVRGRTASGIALQAFVVEYRREEKS